MENTRSRSAGRLTAAALARELWQRHRVLAGAGWLMAAGVVAAVAASLVDDRVITGVNAWVKPTKFFLSTVVYLWSLAWFMPEMRPDRRRLASSLGTLIALLLVVEIGLVTMQAARGTTSHFNIATPVDAAIFNWMGVLIVLNTVAVAALLPLLARIEATRAAYLCGIRLGLLLFIGGSLLGFTMVVNQGHNFPGPDGSAGLPFVNWSTVGGDLRIAHFIGLHALQVVPFAGFLLDRSWAASRRARMATVTALAAGWFVLGSLAVMLAYSGRPLLRL